MSDTGGGKETPLRAGAAEFASMIDRTIRAGFGLALNITGGREEAAEVCEAAYLETWRRSQQHGRWDRVADLAFLQRVRAGAVGMRREAAAGTEADRPNPEPVEASARALT